MAEIQDLNVTDASNTQRFPENQAPSTLNNGGRALEGILARYVFDINTSNQATLSGSTIQFSINRQSITLTGTTANYIDNLLVAFQMGANPITGPVAVNINGIGRIELRDNAGASLTSSALIAGSRVLIVKDAGNNYFRKLFPEYATGSVGLLAANNLSDLNNTSSARTNLGLGTAAVKDTGTSGNTIPLLDGANTFSGLETFSAGANVTPASTPASNAVGYLGAPPNTQDATYTFVMGDCGKSVFHTSSSAHTWTIPPNSTTAFPNGTTIVVVNTGSGTVTIARGSGVTLTKNASLTSANLSLVQNAVGTLYKAGTNTWIGSGSLT